MTASSAIEQERTIVAITSAAFSCSCCASTIPTCSYHVPLLLPFGLVLSLGILTTILPAFVLRSLSPQEPLATAQPSLPSGVVLPSHRRRRSCQHCSVLLRVVVRCASCETTLIRKSVGAREGKGVDIRAKPVETEDSHTANKLIPERETHASMRVQEALLWLMFLGT